MERIRAVTQGRDLQEGPEAEDIEEQAQPDFLYTPETHWQRCYCPLWAECSHINPTSQFNGVIFFIEIPFQVAYVYKRF